MSRIAPLALLSLTVACGLALAGPAFADGKHDHVDSLLDRGDMNATARRVRYQGSLGPLGAGSS